MNDANAKARRSASLDWNVQTLLVAYDRVGHRNPRWDAPAESGLAMAARVWADDPTRPADAADQAWTSLREAIAHGCDDPLVAYVAARFSGSDLPALDAANATIATALRLQDSAYPAFRRGYAMLMGAAALLAASRGTTPEVWEPRWKVICDLLNRALVLLPDVARDHSLPDDMLLTYVNDLQDTWAGGGQDRAKAFKEIEEAVSAARDATDPVLPLMRGWFDVSYAWDVRGTDVAAKVKPQAWAPFRERLAQGEGAVAQAVSLGSTDPAVPAIMTMVVKGLYAHPEELEQWFVLWQRLEPGAYAPYAAKLQWILPKWYGSADAALDFAREVRQAGNWSARAPLLIVDAHRALGEGSSTRADHLRPPGPCVDILDVYRELLEQYPNAVSDRGAYTWWLTECDEWPEAERQFQTLTGDRLRVGAFGGQAEYERRRERSAAHAGKREQ